MAAAFLLDADAVIILHSLGLIEPLCAAIRAGTVEAHCTRYVWEQELAALREPRARLESAGLRVHRFDPGSTPGLMWRHMLRERGSFARNNRGEVELVAFARCCEDPMVLVARDEGARRLAEEHRLGAIDVADFICELIVRGVLSEGAACAALSPWDNPGAGNGRPKHYRGFDEMLATWRARTGSRQA